MALVLTQRLISDQIVTMQSPAELSGQLDDLLDGVESIRQTAVDIDHAERAEGRSSYTLGKLITFAVATVAAYSNKPLVYSIYLGAIFWHVFWLKREPSPLL